MILVVLFARRATPKIMMKKMALIKVTVRFIMMMPVNESTCNKSITILTTLI